MEPPTTTNSTNSVTDNNSIIAPSAAIPDAVQLDATQQSPASLPSSTSSSIHQPHHPMKKNLPKSGTTITPEEISRRKELKRQAAAAPHHPKSGTTITPEEISRRKELKRQAAAALLAKEEEDFKESTHVSSSSSTSALASVGDLFVCREYETRRFDFGQGASHIGVECLVAASTDFDLTGQIIWPAARLTSWYLAHLGRVGKLNRSSCVLELGAGCGLCSLVASQFCGSVCMSDNEPEVLTILELNVTKRHTPSPEDCITSVADLNWGKEDHHVRMLQMARDMRTQVALRMEKKNVDGGGGGGGGASGSSDGKGAGNNASSLTTSSSTAAAATAERAAISPQRKWPLLVGADVVYWSEAIAPLFETVAALLDKEDGEFILGYFDRLASNRDKVEAEAMKQGLQWVREDLTLNVKNGGFLPDPLPQDIAVNIHKMHLYRFRW